MRYAERILYEYGSNVLKLEMLKEEVKEITSLAVQKYEKIGNNRVDPVILRTEKLLKMEREILRLKKITGLVEKIEEELKLGTEKEKEMLEILRERYYKHKRWEYVEGKMKISRATIKRRREELIYRVIKKAREK